MITLPSKADQDRMLALATGEEDFGVRFVLHVGDDDYSPKFREGKWGQGGLPISLDAPIGGVLPRRLDGAPVRLGAEIDGITVPQVPGVFTVQKPGVGTTQLTTASAGALAGRWRLRETVEYPGVSPEYVARDGARRLPYKGPIVADPLGSPLLTFEGPDDGFKPGEFVSDIFSVLAPDGAAEDFAPRQVPYVLRDTADGGFRAQAFVGLGFDAGEVALELDGDTMPDFLPERSIDQYAAVEVYMLNPDGSDAYRQVAEVPYRGVDYPPPVGLVLGIPFSDASAEGPKNGQTHANRMAGAIGRGLYGGTTTLPVYCPLIERADRFLIRKTHRDDDGTWQKLWLCVTGEYGHELLGGSSGGASPEAGLSTTVAYKATLLEEDLVAVPAMIVPVAAPPGTPGTVVQTPRDPYGVEGDYMYFDGSVAWARAEGDYLILAESSGHVAVSGDYAEVH